MSDVAYDPLRYAQAGEQRIDRAFTGIANRRAGQALQRGDYGAASGALFGNGDIAGGAAIQDRQVQQQTAQRTQQQADLAKQVAFTRQATTTIRRAMTEGANPVEVFDSFAPAFAQLGIDPQAQAQYRQALAANPQQFLDTVDQATAQQERDLEIVNRGGGSVTVFDKGTGEIVNDISAPRPDYTIGTTRFSGETNEPLAQGYVAPQYERITNSDGSTSIIEIPRSGAAGVPAAATSGGGAQPRGLRNNNPGNIEDGPFARSLPGYAGSDGRFARFDTMEQGQAAGGALLDSYARRGVVTPAQVINRWAPPSDNNPTDAYAAYVARRLGIGVNDPIPAERRGEAFQAINEFENGQRGPSQGGGQAPAAAGPRVVAQGQNLGLTPAQQLAQDRDARAEASASRTGQSQLRREFNARPEVKEYREADNSFRQMQSYVRHPSAAGDLSLIFAFMKVLDPTSTVREGEFATASNAGSVDDALRNRYNRVVSGERLQPRQREDFLAQAGNIMQTRRSRFDEIEGEYRFEAEQQGYDPARIVGGGGQPQQQRGPQTNAPGLPFNITPQQLQFRQQLVQSGRANVQSPRGSQTNPIYVNPADEATSYGNIRAGAWFVAPSGEVLQKPPSNNRRRR